MCGLLIPDGVIGWKRPAISPRCCPAGEAPAADLECPRKCDGEGSVVCSMVGDGGWSSSD